MSKLNEAIKFASDKHDGQIRKLTNLPYIFHPFEVAQIVATMTDDEDAICAALLHDTVEDTKTTLDEIADKFGLRVMRLVALETENKREHVDPSLTWKTRKEESLEEISVCNDLQAKMIWLGDKLSNIRSLYRYYIVNGEKMWETFNEKDPRNHAWYYRSIVRILKDLDGYAAYREFRITVEALFGGYDEI